MEPSLNRLMSMVSTIEDITSNQDLLDHFVDYTRTLGFSHCALGPLQNPSFSPDFIFSNLPPEILRQWQKQDHLLHDPVIHYAMATDEVFTWAEAREHASRFGIKIFNKFEKRNLANGIGIPVKIKSMPKGLVSLAHENPKFSATELTNLRLVCIETYSKFLALNNMTNTVPTKDLTKREIDVLHYVAAGKSNWEAGVILNISEDGVKKHMQNICRKLGATNRVHAVMIAARAGKILP